MTTIAQMKASPLHAPARSGPVEVGPQLFQDQPPSSQCGPKSGQSDGPPMPMQAARRIKRASTKQDEHVAAPGLLSRVVALLRGQ